MNSKYFDIGLTLTILLIGVSGMFTFVNEFNPTGIMPNEDLYSEDAIETRIGTLQPDTETVQDVNTGIWVYDVPANMVAGIGNAIETGLGYLAQVINGFLNLSYLIWSMLTGWAVITYAILEPSGLGGLATVIVAILGAIELITLFVLVSEIVLGLLGRFS